MNRRIRAQSTTTAKNSDNGYLRYLKPGALAQLRDSKIKTRSHLHHSQIYLHLPILSTSTSPTSPSSPSPSRSPTPTAADELAGTVNDVVLPYFSRCLFGPRFPQRKKLMAAKSMLINGNSNSTSPDSSPQSVIDVFGSDFLFAH